MTTLTSAPTTWYDVLDVEPDRAADEIRAAWRAAVADLDPTDRRFRVYNQAAEVLLDPERRAAYDAELGADARRAEPGATSRGEPDRERAASPSRPREARAAPARAAAVVPGLAAGRRSAAVAALLLAAAPAVAWSREPSDAAVARRHRGRPGGRRAGHRPGPVLRRPRTSTRSAGRAAAAT